MKQAPTLLMVANWDSGVGYAWWLMEGYWAALAKRYAGEYRVLLAYPSISVVPPAIVEAPVEVVQWSFQRMGVLDVLAQALWLGRHRVKAIYFTDRPTVHWSYALYRIAGIRRIVVHDHTPGRRRTGRIKLALKKLIHRLSWVSADAALGATGFVRRRLVDVNGVPESRCHVVRNGIPLAEPGSAQNLHSLFGIPSDRRILVMCARANRYKGIGFLLSCMSALKEKGRDDIHLLFIGDGPHLGDFVRLAERTGIAAACTFCGRRNDVSTLLPAADIAIHPSRGEVGYSLAILEYMRAGLPVVVPDNPSVCGATVHKGNGLIYRESEVESAVEMVIRLLDDDSLRLRLGAQGRADVAQYSLNVTHTELLMAFEKIM